MLEYPPDHICPKCDSFDIMRVPPRRPMDRVRRLFGLRVYQCRKCGARFYDQPADRKAS
jgi:ribosomal protein L37AE/L43A